MSRLAPTTRPKTAPRTGIALLLLVGIWGCRPEPGAETLDGRVEAALAGLDLTGRAELLLLPRITAPEPSDTAALRALRAAAAGGRLSGVWFDGGHASAVAAATSRLRSAGGTLPLIFAADVDEGLGGSIDGAPDLPALPAAAVYSDPDAVRAAGADVAAQAALLGINLGVVRAPPLEAGSPRTLLRRAQDRTHAAISGFTAEAESRGLLMGVIPLWSEGGGAEPQPWDLSRLSAIELQLLRRLAVRPLGMLLLEPLVIPAVTGDTLPLSQSAVFVQGMVRRDLQWEGVIGALLPPAQGSDDLDAIVRNIAAGVDLVVGVADRAAAASAIAAAVQRGAIPDGRVHAAARRVLRLRGALRSDTTAAPPADSVPGRLTRAEWLERAAGMMRSASHLLPASGTPAPQFPAGGDSVLLVTPAASGGILAAELRRALPLLRHLSIDLEGDSAGSHSALAAALPASRAVLVAEFPGASPLRFTAGLLSSGDADSLPSLTRILFRPSVGRVGAPAPAYVIWGTGSVAQHTAASFLLGGGDLDGPPDELSWPLARILYEAEPEAVAMSEDGLLRVDRIVRDAIDDELFPGAVVVVGRSGGLVRMRGYGRTGPSSEADADSIASRRSANGPGASRAAAEHLPVNAVSTLYDIASLTKVVGTTAAVMRLVDEGRMQIDASIRRYVPEYRVEGADRITVRNLLAHTSGIPSGLWLYGSAGSPSQALRQVLQQPLRREPGERVEYSDLGMILLAEAAERAAEMPLDRYLAREVYAPLGMGSTMYIPPAWLRSRIPPTAVRSEREFVLRGVVHDGNAFRLGGVAGHAGLFSTGYDVAVFAQTMLNGGAYGLTRVFTPETVAEFTRKQPGAAERALGWDTPAARSSAGRFLSARSYGHTGYTGTSLWIDPELDLFVVILTNRTLNRTAGGEMLRFRSAVHEAVAQAVTEPRIRTRPGSRR